jgi:pyridoxamine 5'-phosphate oxidase
VHRVSNALTSCDITPHRALCQRVTSQINLYDQLKDRNISVSQYVHASTLMLIRRSSKIFGSVHTTPRLSLFCTPNRYSPKPLYGAYHTSSKMLHSAKPDSNSTSKRIFAPTGGSTDPGHATQYQRGSLEKEDLHASPTTQFHTWFQEAISANVYQPETVTLATASLPDGKPSARMVFMKELDDKGFVIYSNWETSRKSKDVASNPQAALTFWWREVERQVRVEGAVERLTSEESQVYYDTRIRGSRIGAWASPQSQVLGTREELVDKVDEVEKRFHGKDKIPVPEFWGGIRVIPDVMEFWQGRESRLHDRFRYTREKENGKWKVERLSP